MYVYIYIYTYIYIYIYSCLETPLSSKHPSSDDNTKETGKEHGDVGGLKPQVIERHMLKHCMLCHKLYVLYYTIKHTILYDITSCVLLCCYYIMRYYIILYYITLYYG